MATADGSNEHGVSVVLCNCPSDRAEAIARAVVDQQVAACVNIIPGVTSVYRWRGTVEQATESTLLIKTATSRVDVLSRAIKALHPYDVPEILAIPVTTELSEAAYLRWVIEESTPETSSTPAGA